MWSKARSNYPISPSHPKAADCFTSVYTFVNLHIKSLCCCRFLCLFPSLDSVSKAGAIYSNILVTLVLRHKRYSINIIEWMNEEISKLFIIYVNVQTDFLEKEWERGVIQPVWYLATEWKADFKFWSGAGESNLVLMIADIFPTKRVKETLKWVICS